MRLYLKLTMMSSAAVVAMKEAKWTLLNDTDFYGNDVLGSVATGTIEACAELCLSIRGCASASWNGPNSRFKDKNCNLHCRGDNPSKSPGETGILISEGDLCSSLIIPWDWNDAYLQGDLLYTANEDQVKYRPEIGNGFMATVVGSDTLFAAGVFNGKALDPSHRAEIPAPLALHIDGQVVGAGLDLRHGAYLRRYSVSGGVLAELRFYAHREKRSLLAVELNVLSAPDASAAIEIMGSDGSSPSSKDFTWSVAQHNISGRSVHVWSGEALAAELPTSKKTRVAVVLPTNVTGTVPAHTGSRILYLAALRTSLESEDPEAAALADWDAGIRASSTDVFQSHAAAWAGLWDSGLEVSGRMDVARAVNSSQYYILSSVRDDAVYSLSPGGLASNGYNGHTFWDCETWMYPSLVLWHPNIAASLLQYRVDRVDEAVKKALSYNKGYKGAMFPWESAATGTETCPTWASTGQLEQHISGDIAFAVQQYWYATQNVTWLRHVYPSLLRATADFWVSRVEIDGMQAHIRHVIPPDEYATGDDSVYTNFVAQRNLAFAAEAAAILGETPDPRWLNVSQKLVLLFDEKLGIHPEYQGYHGQKIKQADVVLLGFPLMKNMTAATRKADLDYYAARTDTSGPAMTWGMHAVGFLELGNSEQAASNFNRSFANAQQPFYVWTETPTGGAVNFLTGVGGFLQTALFGLAGLRIWATHLALNPSLVEGMTSVVLRGLHYHGAVFKLSYNDTAMTLFVASGPSLSVTTLSQKTLQVSTGQGVTLSRGPARVQVSVAQQSETLYI